MDYIGHAKINIEMRGSHESTTAESSRGLSTTSVIDHPPGGGSTIKVPLMNSCLCINDPATIHKAERSTTRTVPSLSIGGKTKVSLPSLLGPSSKEKRCLPLLFLLAYSHLLKAL